jgi:hypothetical protein
LAFGQDLACVALNFTAVSSASASLQIALCGHSEMQTPQSMQVSGSITYCVSQTCIALTGQTLAQQPHFTQEVLITEGISYLPKKMFPQV